MEHEAKEESQLTPRAKSRNEQEDAPPWRNGKAQEKETPKELWKLTESTIPGQEMANIPCPGLDFMGFSALG